jgi:ligand-binding sensor domain-containing protein
LSKLSLLRIKGWTIPHYLILILLVAVLIRLWAVFQLPVDYDEPVYLDAGFDYATLFRAGDWRGVIDYPGNLEHPPLVKIFFGLAIFGLGEQASWTDALIASRLISAIFGVLGVLLMALLNPWAGGLFALHTLVVKYTSQAYLEAIPLFFTIAAVATLYYKNRFIKPDYENPNSGQRTNLAKSGSNPKGIWLWLSAMSLGLALAGKYSYFPIAAVIIYLLLVEMNIHLRGVMLYLAVASITFFIFNPSLWSGSLSHIWDTLSFHGQYAQSAHVQASRYPWFQPIVWISRSMGFQWHPEVFFYLGIDGLIFILAAIGMYREWRARRWLPLWIIMGLVALFLWPTKWPQYTLLIIPGLCLVAGPTAMSIFHWISEKEDYYGFLKEMFPSPPRAIWVLLGLFTLLLTVGYVANFVAVTLARAGWSQVTTGNSPLPNQTVNSLLALQEGKVAIGTDRGAAIWSYQEGNGPTDQWVVYDTENSSLPHNRVLSLSIGRDGSLCFGTMAGLSCKQGENWQNYRAKDFGLESEQVLAQATGKDGELWVGTPAGVAVYDGRSWIAYKTENSDLIHDAVFSIVVKTHLEGDEIWFGTLTGVSVLDSSSGDWRNYPLQDMGSGWGGVADITIDVDGKVWVATLGGGLNLWDGKAWRYYRASNSGLPLNTVRVVAETQPGVIWAGMSTPNHYGGVLATFDGGEWLTLTNFNSGYPDSEPLTIEHDETGRIWIGTRTEGLILYQPTN